MSKKQQPDRQIIAISNLDFDPDNPRFPSEVASGPEQDLIERFIRDERLLEVINSIADQGYFDGEPLLVVPVENSDRYYVIEGNRRLAALKLLNGLASVPVGRTSIEDACELADHRPTEVPCLVFDNEDAILRYLGFRHITGIKSWSSLQKARYLKKLKDRFYSGKSAEKQLTALAREIGSRADYVGQMLAALNLFERAEAENFFDLPGISVQDIDFSLLTTAISYSSIVKYIGLENRKDSIGVNINEDALKNIVNWLFVSRGGQKTVLGDSRNLKRLAAVVESDAACQQLIDDSDLDSAYQLSRGPAQALTVALKAVEKKLQEAWTWMPLVDRPQTGDEDVADSIRKRASALRDAIIATRSEEND